MKQRARDTHREREREKGRDRSTLTTQTPSNLVTQERSKIIRSFIIMNVVSGAGSLSQAAMNQCGKQRFWPNKTK